MKHVHRKIPRTPAEIAKLKADRERYQREKPTPEQLLAEGGHEHFIRHGDLLMFHCLMFELRKERERQKLTIAQLAEMTGIDQSALSRLETYKNANPTFQTVSRIAAALGKFITFSLTDAAKKSRKAPLVTT
jgi:DNA-binding phage protein